MDVYTAALALLASSTLLFIVLVAKTRLGVVKSFIVVLLFVKIWAGTFYLLGLDRPLWIIRTRIGSATVTAMQLLFLSALLTNLWLAGRVERLERFFK